jgi:arylsulfatase A-like enzyme
MNTCPNILFILADDLGYADLSCYGQLDYATPHLDQLAAAGVRFAHGYANSPVCSASRTALLTGRYQYRLRVGLEEPLSRNSPGDAGLPPEHPTLTSLLRDQGYRTSLIGKWHLGNPPAFSPLKSGYDYFFGVNGGFADYFRHGPDSISPLRENGNAIARAGYMTDVLADRAVELVADYAAGPQPFFMSLNFTAPHWPWEGPDDEPVSRRFTQYEEYFHYDGGTQRTYAAMVERLDAAVGRVLAALADHGLADDTIVVFTSDNGGERFSKTWPFTGMKTELLEGGLRVPTLLRWPAVLANMVSDQVTATMDWLPTLLAAAGAQPDPAYPPDGENLLPVLLGHRKPYPRRLYWRYKFAAQRAVRDGAWKYLRIAGHEFLFDVVQDPRERANLRDVHPAVFAQLKQDFEAWNATMLPESDTPVGHYNAASLLADHYGVTSDLRMLERAPCEVPEESRWPN